MNKPLLSIEPTPEPRSGAAGSRGSEAILIVNGLPDVTALTERLRTAGLPIEPVSVAAACGAIRAGNGIAVIVTAAALDALDIALLLDSLGTQPAWLDTTILAIGANSQKDGKTLDQLDTAATVIRIGEQGDPGLVVELARAAVRSRVAQHKARQAIALLETANRQSRGDTLSAETPVLRNVVERTSTDDTGSIKAPRIQANDERSRALIEFSDLITFSVDAEGTLIAIDQDFYERTGFARDTNLSLMSDKLRVHPDDRDHVRDMQQSALAKKTGVDYEYRCKVADGSYRWWQFRATPVPGADGDIAGWNGTLLDIHDRKLAEERLKESDLRHRSSIAISHLITFVLDPDGQLLDIDDRMCEITGLPFAVIIAQWPNALCHPDDLLELIRRYDTALETRGFDFTLRVRHADGAYKWWRVRSAPRCDDLGEIIGWFGTMEDVNLLILAREQLKASEAMHRYSVELTDQIAWSATADGTITTIGDRIFALLGIECDVWMAMTPAERIHSADIPELIAGFKDARKSLKTADIRHRLVCADGSYRWWRSRSAPLLDADGRVSSWHGILEDVDDLHRAEERLRESEERYRFSIGLSSLLTYTMEPSGKIKNVYEFVKEDAGFVSNDVTGRFSGYDWHPDCLEATHVARADAMKYGQYDITGLMGNPEVGYSWCRSRAAPCRNDDGSVAYWHGTLENVDALIRAEEKLRESENRHRLCIKLSNLITYTTSPTGVFESIDESIYLATGVPVATILNNTSDIFCHPDDIVEVQGLRAAAISSGIFDHTHRLRGAGGVYRWWRSRAKPMRDAAGNIERWYGTLEDINDLRQAEEKLRLSEELHRFSLQLSNTVVWSADPKGVLTDVDERLFEIAGVSRELLMGGKLRDWLHPDDAARMSKRRRESLETGGPADFDFRMRNDNGDYQWWRWRSASQRGASGEIVRWYGTLENIDALRSAEEHLRASEELHRYSIELSNLIVWTGSKEGQFLTVGPKIFERLGITREAAKLKRPIDWVHLDDFAIAANAFKAGVKSGTPADFRLRLRLADATYRWWRLRASPILAEDGSILRWYGTLEDVDDLHRAEEKLRESEAIYRNTIELSNQVVLTTSATGKLLSVADNWEQLTGWPQPTMSGGALDTRLSHPDDVQRIDAERIAAYRQVIALDQNFRMLSPDGSYRWWRLRAAPRQSDVDGVLRWYCTLEDINLFRATVVSLREAEEIFRYTVELSGQVVITADGNGAITSVHPRWTEMTGIPTNELLGTGLFDLVHPDNQAGVAKGWRERVAGGTEADHVLRLRQSNGSYRWWRVRAAPRRDDNGIVISWYGTIENVDTVTRAEIDLEQLRAEMVHLSRLNAMGTMASTLAHELNQPLAAVLNYVGGSRRLLATSSGPEIKRIQAAMRNAEDCAMRASEIIRKVRKQVSRGEPTYNYEDVAILISDASSIALINARALGITVERNLAPDARRVYVDNIQIQQILINLLRNALEAVSDVLVRTIHITSSLESGFCAISISDSGAGIAKSMEARLFEPFESTKPEGTGIGLSISRTIAESHGGKLEYSASALGGACFTVTLPTEPQYSTLEVQ